MASDRLSRQMRLRSMLDNDPDFAWGWNNALIELLDALEDGYTIDKEFLSDLRVEVHVK